MMEIQQGGWRVMLSGVLILLRIESVKGGRGIFTWLRGTVRWLYNLWRGVSYGKIGTIHSRSYNLFTSTKSHSSARSHVSAQEAKLHVTVYSIFDTQYSILNIRYSIFEMIDNTVGAVRLGCLRGRFRLLNRLTVLVPHP